MPVGANLSTAEYLVRVPGKTAQKDFSFEIMAENFFVETERNEASPDGS
jgi:hypothetical protein